MNHVIASAIRSPNKPSIKRLIKPGDMFKHYKGSIYAVTNVSTHTETSELLVVYYNVNEPSISWARPLTMFNDYVTINNLDILRFDNVDSNTR